MHCFLHVRVLSFTPFCWLLFLCEGISCLFDSLLFHLERRQNTEFNPEKTKVLTMCRGLGTMHAGKCYNAH